MVVPCTKILKTGQPPLKTNAAALYKLVEQKRYFSTLYSFFLYKINTNRQYTAATLYPHFGQMTSVINFK